MRGGALRGATRKRRAEARPAASARAAPALRTLPSHASPPRPSLADTGVNATQGSNATQSVDQGSMLFSAVQECGRDVRARGCAHLPSRTDAAGSGSRGCACFTAGAVLPPASPPSRDKRLLL